MNYTEHRTWGNKKKNFGLSLGSTEELLSDAEYVVIALGLFGVLVLAYLISEACRKA